MGTVKSKREQGYRRRAHHAGSWYSSEQQSLDATLAQYLRQVDRDGTKDPSILTVETEGQSSAASDTNSQDLRGLVVPHAGYTYSGPTAAYAYRALSDALQPQQPRGPSPIQSIVVLHPSHHLYLKSCAVSGATLLETPLGNLTVDTTLRDEILQLSSSLFGSMDESTDEQEHSGEMQYPFIRKVCNDTERDVKVLPIMVGALDTRLEAQVGAMLAPIVARPTILTVVSSDFCHWGHRFQYQPTGTNGMHIFQHIQDLDHTGISHIELQEPGAFATYLKRTSNTICGRHAIAVWLHAVRSNRDAGTETLDVKFVKYNQSSSVQDMDDSSVSYASAVARVAR